MYKCPVCQGEIERTKYGKCPLCQTKLEIHQEKNESGQIAKTYYTAVETSTTKSVEHVVELETSFTEEPKITDEYINFFGVHEEVRCLSCHKVFKNMILEGETTIECPYCSYRYKARFLGYGRPVEEVPPVVAVFNINEQGNV